MRLTGLAVTGARPAPAEGAAPAPLLSVRDLSVRFPARRGGTPVHAVRGVSFDIAPGETLALVGESGSGKTSTARAVLQLQDSDAGTVQLNGEELTGLPAGRLRALRRHMQFVQQNPYASLHPRMKVADILAEPLRVHGTVAPQSIAARVSELMSLVGLDPAGVNRFAHSFSGGQRQRIAIARALAVHPDLVVCDEPVSALDVRTQAQIVALLRSLQQRLGLSYLFIAHDLALVRQVAHRVAVMVAGHLVEIGPVDAVFDRPGHPYTRTLLQAVPVPDPAAQRSRLAELPDLPDFRAAETPSVPCAMGSNHDADRSPTWHWLRPGHGVSCRCWPRDQH